MKKLTELNLPKSRFDADTILRSAGYKRLGKGSYGAVYSHPQKSYVLKIFSSKDRAYLEYIQIAKNNPNPHFPKFIGKIVKLSSEIYAIRMEKLEQFSSLDIYNHAASIIKEYIIRDNDDYEYMMYHPTMKAACDIIRDNLSKKYQIDLFTPNNLMKRGEDIVITDPVYDSSIIPEPTKNWPIEREPEKVKTRRPLDDDLLNKIFQELDEKYSVDNNILLKHLSDREIDPYHAWYDFAEWASTNDDIVSILEKLSGDELDAENYEDIADNIRENVEPELFYKLPKTIQDNFTKHYESTVMDTNPAEAPAYMHFSLDNSRLIHRTSWLIHFSDNAEDIAYNGFRYGVDNFDRLGLSTWFNQESKKFGGYNFAFEATSRYVDGGSKKYGKHAVIFQNSGVKAWHYGDEEDQIIFWGADVDPKTIIYLYNDYGDWCVMPHPSNNMDKPLFKSEKIENVVKWVIQNNQQYRKVIYGK